EIRNAGDGVLDPVRDDLLHLLGADIAVAHADAELRKLDRREQIDGQKAKADQAERDDDEKYHRRRDRPLYGNVCDGHDDRAPLRGRFSSTSRAARSAALLAAPG